MLESGAPLVTERIEGVRSVSFGIWVKAGARFETPQNKGISHFLEHMSFKGTARRTQKQIAFEIDSLGGDLNAFTSKESTVFYVKVLDEYIDRGIDLLIDIFLNSSLPPEEIEKEKGIVSEEIRMIEDTPDDYVHDLFNEFVWGENGLGYNILGSEETVNSFNRTDLIDYRKRFYRLSNVVFSVAGNIDSGHIYGLLESLLPGEERGLSSVSMERPVFRRGVKVVTKDHAEVHLCMGVEGIAQNSPDRYAMLLLNTIMGSGVSSRLFQEIRETRGLAYTVYSYLTSYHDTGLFGVYVGTSERNYREVVELVRQEFRSFRDTLTEDELQRAKTHLRGNIILALESTSGRMNNIARQEIYYGRYFSPSEILSAIDGVTLQEMKGLAERLFTDDGLATVLLGPVSDI
jgi:predicted Zn-dependent peptidase